MQRNGHRVGALYSPAPIDGAFAVSLADGTSALHYSDVGALNCNISDRIGGD